MKECTIFRVKDKTGNFTIMLNEVFQRSDLSARAKGLYGYLMTLPDDWKIYKQEIYKHFSDGKTRLDNAFKELEKAGYICKERIRGEDNLFHGWNFTVQESVHSPILGLPKVGNTESRESRQSENLSLLSTNINKVLTKQNTNETYIHIFEEWNTQPSLPTHKQSVIDRYFKKKHRDLIDEIGHDATLRAVRNYADILASEKYYFSHKWTLWDFIVRGLHQFVDDMSPHENFMSGKVTEDRNYKEF